MGVGYEIKIDGQSDFKELIEKSFEISPSDVRNYSPLTLAYIGDAVYEIIIRTLLVEKGNRSANSLHKDAIHFVKAGAQAKIILSLEGELTEEEMDVFKRGRNAKSYTMAKNASMSDYRHATGFEALVGYLYLQGKQDRLIFLVKKGIELAGIK